MIKIFIRNELQKLVHFTQFVSVSCLVTEFLHLELCQVNGLILKKKKEKIKLQLAIMEDKNNNNNSQSCQLLRLTTALGFRHSLAFWNKKNKKKYGAPNGIGFYWKTVQCEIRKRKYFPNIPTNPDDLNYSVPFSDDFWSGIDHKVHTC